MITLGEQRTRGLGGLRSLGKDGATAELQARLIDAQRINARKLDPQAKASANWAEWGSMGGAALKTMGVGLRLATKAAELPPNPTVRASAPYPTHGGPTGPGQELMAVWDAVLAGVGRG